MAPEHADNETSRHGRKREAETNEVTRHYSHNMFIMRVNGSVWGFHQIPVICDPHRKIYKQLFSNVRVKFIII